MLASGILFANGVYYSALASVILHAYLSSIHKKAKGLILFNFPALMRPQCSLEIREQTFPYLEVVSVTDPQNAAHVPLALLHQPWKIGKE